MSKQKFGIALCAGSLLLLLWVATVHAQVVGSGWSEPYRISSSAGKSSEGFPVADQYGYVHVFWTEMGSDDQRTVLRYARFDGETWTLPNDLYGTGYGIKNVSPVVDQHGTLHIAWAEGLSGPAYYTHAPANNAISVQNWAKPIRINIPARTLHLRIDSKDVFHILYIDQFETPGVFYIRSEDQAATWSKPVRLDPDILPNHIPDSLNFELDENDGMHAVWFYGALDQGDKPDLVRYSHSLDGGKHWSAPFNLDQYNAENGHDVSFASPKMVVAGTTVHVIWAAGTHTNRNHRFSTDAGQTWSETRRVFGELEGQAFDGLAVDRAGRVYYFGQIRYPQGIYMAVWDQNQWSSPSLIYLIVPENSEEGMGDRIHAHYTIPVVRAGNQLVLTFTDPPADENRRLFAMYHTLEDISPLKTVPTPVSVPSPTPVQTAAIPALAATASIVDTPAAQPMEEPSRPDISIWVALIPTLLLLGGMLVIRLLDKSNY